ncbi:MAG: cation:proton antiporter [Planctomycetota bacterium]
MDYGILAVLAGFGLLYSAVAGGIERSWISGPIIFTAFGLLLGPYGLQLLSMESNPELLKSMAELTLALVLFTDAASADLGVIRLTRRLPVRLLAVGLPLTILLGYGAGELMFGALTALEVALIATILAPTDAALGQAVVSNEAVPDPIRQGLSVESGLNDGICVPVLFLFLALMTNAGGDDSTLAIGLKLFAEEVGIGLASGAVLTGVAVWLLKLCRRRDWVSPIWIKVIVVALAFVCFGTAQSLGGSGFIACFVGGMLFGALLKPYHEELLGAAEGVGGAFSLLTWVLFGAAVVGAALQAFTWQAVVYAALSLTVIRMLPVFLVLTGLPTSVEDKLFVGWFGPRGLASIVFVVIVSTENVPHFGTIATVVVCTIIGSIIAHGVTANPWARAYGARARRADPGA